MSFRKKVEGPNPTRSVYLPVGASTRGWRRAPESGLKSWRAASVHPIHQAAAREHRSRRIAATSLKSDARLATISERRGTLYSLWSKGKKLWTTFSSNWRASPGCSTRIGLFSWQWRSSCLSCGSGTSPRLCRRVMLMRESGVSRSDHACSERAGRGVAVRSSKKRQKRRNGSKIAATLAMARIQP